MKKPNFRAAWHKAAAVRTSRYGLWSAGITALAVAVAITVNLLVGQLPETWTQFDMSGSGIYDITDTSRDYLADLTEDVEIHVLANEESLDTRITRFLSLYQDLSVSLRPHHLRRGRKHHRGHLRGHGTPGVLFD